jgi:hypothetical protein
VYARGESSDAARDAAAAAFTTACAPYLDALRGIPAHAALGDDTDREDVVMVVSVGSLAATKAAALETVAAARRVLMTCTVLIEPLGWPASPSVARGLAAAAGCDVARVRRAGALLESAAAALAGRELVSNGSNGGGDNDDDLRYRRVPALAAIALPLHALRRRLALSTDGGEHYHDVSPAPLALAHGLRAAGAALLTGAAYGAGGGLARVNINPILYPLTPYILHLTPYTLHPTPYTLHPTPYTLTLYPTPYSLHPTPYTLHPTPYTLHPSPYTLTLHPLLNALH